MLGPVLARDYLGGARAWGAILACYGGGAIIGGLLALGRRPRRPLVVSTLTTLGFPLPPLALALHLPARRGGRRGAAGGRGLRLRRRDRDDRDAAARARRRAVPRRLVQHGRRVRVRPARVHRGRPVAAAFGARAVLGFGAAWAAFGTLAVLAVPAVRTLTWQDTPTDRLNRLRTLGAPCWPRRGRRAARQQTPICTRYRTPHSTRLEPRCQSVPTSANPAALSALVWTASCAPSLL